MRLALQIARAHVVRRKRQSLVSILGVALGVGFFIAMASMMQGFQRDFVARVIDVQPHVVVKDEYRERGLQPGEAAAPGDAVEVVGLKPRDEPRGIRNARATMAAIADMPGVAVAPTLNGQAFLRYGARDIAANLIGIEPVAERRVGNLDADMIEGSLDALQRVANGVILGDGLARKLGATTGTTLTLVSTRGTALKVKVVGLFRTGITSLDNGTVYTLLKKAQIVQDRPNVVNQLRLRIVDVTQAQEVARHIEARFGYRAEPWQEANANVLGIFVIQNAVMYSTVGAILIVACFGIFNVVSTVVYEKTRDIAILKSMGFAERDIRRIFVLQGFLVGVVGVAFGWLLGFAIVEAMATLRFDIEGFVRTQGFILYRSPMHYALSGGFALGAAVFAAWLPARRAARVNPVDIVRGAA